MTRKPEPLLNAVARKIGQAAGTLANVTHILTSDPREFREASKSGSHHPTNPEPIHPAPSERASAPAEAAPTKQHKSNPKKRTARSGTAARKTTTAAKQGSRRKR
jgi:hypothetical protein